MQINSGQITPGPSLFQALQSGPKTQAAGQENKPVGEPQEQSAVQASEKTERSASDEDRASRRGGLVDLSV